MKRKLSRFLNVKVFLFISLIILVNIKYEHNSYPKDIKPAVQKKLTIKMKKVEILALNSVIIEAVKLENKTPSYPKMTQEKWQSLSNASPIIFALSHNSAAKQLQKFKDKDKSVSEAFINAFNGTKVALLAKTTSWNHKNFEKHIVPLSGSTWQGPLEFDESEDTRQIQLSVPIKDENNKIIGSLVIGFNALVTR